MKKHKNRHQHREKPRMCDPGMCDHCHYIGEGDFICDNAPEGPVLVVQDWTPNEDAWLYCHRGGTRHGGK